MLGWVLGALALLWLLGELKTSRSDGTPLRISPVRRMLLAISPQKKDAIVFFDAEADATRLIEWLPKARERFGADLTHAAVAAGNIGLGCTPRMNRFVSGLRLYQRTQRSLTFSMKRRVADGAIDRKADLATLKIDMRDGETFAELCARVNAGITVNRSGERTRADQEYQLFDLLPRALLGGAARLLRRLDHSNLLPAFFIADDPLFTSIFIANLGSVKMGSAYHHLYEYGTCPLFIMFGQIEQRVVVVDGQPVVRPVLPIRFTYDERIEDGMNAKYGIEAVVRVLEAPDRWLGCVADDGSDAAPMWPRADWPSGDGRYAARD
jgi:hypothetical protein